MPQQNFFRQMKAFLRQYLTPAVFWLFTLNVGIFLAQWTILRLVLEPITPRTVVPRLFALDAIAVAHGWLWQLVSYAFLHSDPFHLLSNMLFLWFLGPLVERRIGTTMFYFIFFLAAVLAALSHVGIFWAFQAAGQNPIRYMAGASGAVMCIAVICATYYFNLLVYLFGVWPVKLGWLIIVLVGIDALMLIGPGQSGVAHHAHLVGAAVGFIYARKGSSGADSRLQTTLDIWRYRWRAIWSRLWPFGRKRRKGKADVRNIFDDDYFRR